MTETIRADAAAVLGTRAELGAEYEQHLVDSFADRIEAEIERRSAAAAPPSHGGRPRGDRVGVLAMSLGFGIPLTAVAGGIGHLPGLAIAWAGIAACNLAYAFGDRERDRRRR